MDLSASIIGIICIAICSVPFILIAINQRKKKKKLTNDFYELVQLHGCKIDDFEIGNNYIIGIDQQNRKLFFQSNLESNVHHHIIDLDIIKNAEKNIRKTNQGEQIMQLNLILNPKSTNKAPMNLVFFNFKHNHSLSGELQSLNNWIDKVNALLNS